MKLTSITAERHYFNEEPNGPPLRLLLSFTNGKTLRLQVAGDGQRMIFDSDPLPGPTEMDEFGRTELSDVTRDLFPTLSGLAIDRIAELVWHRTMVGICLESETSSSFYFWVDGDELHWGDSAALQSHDWLDGVLPSVTEKTISVK
ncbi:hypothetical protein [Erythrobacter aureus]|uniref:hypothetical protein n=1 Tax=Erythrobacter aureus TaxID=2182384 RepID=UPI003A9264CF